MTVRQQSRARLGVQHPDEEFEFARFCLLEHYATNPKFMAALEEFVTRHRSALASIKGAMAADILTTLSDYRVAWGLLSFMIDRGGGTAETRRITDYCEELTTLAKAWGLDAAWCALSLHVAIVAKDILVKWPPRHRFVDTVLQTRPWEGRSPETGQYDSGRAPLDARR